MKREIFFTDLVEVNCKNWNIFCCGIRVVLAMLLCAV